MEQFNLDFNSKVKLYKQLYNQITVSIKNNSVPTGTKLPSIRDLSNRLKISKNTIKKTYEELEKSGYIYSLPKSGFFVKNPNEEIPEIQPVTQKDEEIIPTVESIIKQNKDTDLKTDTIQSVPFTSTIKQKGYFHIPHIDDFKSGLKKENKIITNSGDVYIDSSKESNSKTPCFYPDLLESYKYAINENNVKLYSKNGNFGDENLRVALSAFLFKFRKIDINPSQIIVASNIEIIFYYLLHLSKLSIPKQTEGKGLLHLAERASETGSFSSKPTIAIKEDSYSYEKKLFQMLNACVKEVPEDDSGININYLSTSGANILYKTTQDYFYTDNPLCDIEEHDKELMDWVNAVDYHYIIEQDTQTNLDASPTLKSKDKTEKIIYICSFKDLLCKGLSTAFMVLPKPLSEEFHQKFDFVESSISYIEQIALTDFILKGKLLNYLTNIENI